MPKFASTLIAFAMSFSPDLLIGAAAKLQKALQTQPKPHVVDIGANPIDGDPPYKRLLLAELISVTGFEPQHDALAQLVARKGPNERYFPYAIGDGEAATLHVCRAEGMTSLLKPIPTDFFHNFTIWSEIVKTVTIETRRLDDVAEVDALDMLKIDIQGGELSVFRNAVEKLKKTLVIQSEVSFFPLYEKQPGFGEIDTFLRGLGFWPHCFAAINKRIIAPTLINNNWANPLNQLCEADIVYVRALTALETLTVAELEKIALLVHGCYGSIDLALRCLRVADQLDGGGRSDAYLGILSDPMSAQARTLT